jgi:Ca2+-binding EF-hand superfamily protein
MQEDDQTLILQIFQAFDNDHSGTLDINEFRQLLQMLYGKTSVSSQDIDDFCAMLQIDDGKLEYSTFVKAC